MTIAAAAELAAKSGEAVKAGPIGLAVILLLCIASYFLFKSMSKQLRKVREDFPTDEPKRSDDTVDTVDTVDTEASTPPPADR